MAKLPFEFCPVAFEVRCALDERRILDAKRLAARNLRAGQHSQDFLNVVAELLAINKGVGKKGPKKKTHPPHWLEIGTDFLELQADGEKYDSACSLLAKKYGYSKGTIRATVARFRKARDEHDDEVAKFLRDPRPSK